MKNSLILGCIADDFTGASDAASLLVQGGLKTMLINGIPDNTESLDECQAVVIALKSRTEPVQEAVEKSLQAVKWLKHSGARQYYFKYCSTFDSTEKGNIGPVADALMEYLGCPYTLLCPSLPPNGRIVVDGVLYVNGVPLSESHMRNHPLTPMRQSFIPDLMKPQSKYPSYVLKKRDFSFDSVRQKLAAYADANAHFYLVPDYEDDGDAAKLVSLFGDVAFLTGGSGILAALAEKYADQTQDKQGVANKTEGKALILAGSCSVATLGQIDYFQRRGGVSLKLEPAKLLTGEQSLAEICSFIQDHADVPVLLYSSESAEYINSIRSSVIEQYAAILEKTFAAIAVWAKNQAYTRLIVAGGETAGAVVQALQLKRYLIGDSVAVGVPIMIPCEEHKMRLVLKSGNFGGDDFFERALIMTGGAE